MKRISPAALLFALFAIQISPLDAAQDELLGRKTPPLESLAAFAAETPGIDPGAFALSAGESQRLSKARVGERLSLPSVDQYLLPTDPAAEEPLQFRRVELFAPGARVMVLGPEGVIEWQQDARQFYVAANQTTGVGLAVDVASGEISGFAIKGDSKLRLDGQLGVGVELQAVETSPDQVNSCGTNLEDQAPQSLNHLNSPVPEGISSTAPGGAISFQTVVAVDTDNEWMAGKGNDPTTATTWITDTFLAMNVFFERDVETRLLIGDIILRIGSDPYSVPSGSSAQMDEFAQYWRLNMASTQRDFATLFGGRGIGSNSFSGIAWINQYCQKGQVQQQTGRTFGSYSFNAIGTNRTPANTALYIGHELAHNLGSPHTHCYSPTIDQCYNGESGCYSGSPSCPAGGKGTIMSYCHVSGSNGAGCGTNKSEFHSRVQTLIEGRLAANSPSCIEAYEAPPDPAEPPIFRDDFESP